MPLISVLLPNYNNGPFLREAIDSILNQTFDDLELVIVDDASTDNSIEIIDSYSDNRIRLIRKERNSGIVDTLNTGLDNISSKYVARMDGDDISHPQRLEKLISFLEAYEQVGVCSSALELFGARQEVWNVDTNPEILKAGVIRGVTTPHAPSVFRTSVLADKNIRYRNGFPHMEDWDLFFRLKKYTEFRNLPDVLYKYRIQEHNITVVNRPTFWERYKLILRNVLNELEIEPTDRTMDMHIQLFNAPVLIDLIEDLWAYRNLLMAQNSKLMVYPVAAMEKFIDRCWQNMFCRLIDKDPRNYNKFKRLGLPLTWKNKYYYFRCKMKHTNLLSLDGKL